MVTQRNPRKSSDIVRYGLTVIVVLLIGLWQRQAIYDQIQLINYQPPSAIAQLANDATMTDKGRRIYYVNHPQLKSRNNFSSFCPSGTEQSVVLGCYKSDQRGIYLLQVDNKELQGIEQVTAAHEMLHAAYDRLSAHDRRNVDIMLEDYYQHKLTDSAIKQTINDYKTTEPNELVNEMHSIFGSEISDLPPGLQQYYQRYFTNRTKLTGYYQAYQQAFTSRQQQIKTYDAQLNSQKGQIDQLEASDASQQATLKTRREQLDSDRSRDPANYNDEVDSYNVLVKAYNNDVSRLQASINTYNQLVATRNSIAFEERQLTQSISAPASTR